MRTTKRIALAVPMGWEYTHLLTEGILQYQAERGGFLLRDFRFDEPGFCVPPHPPTWEGWDPSGVLCAVGSEAGLAPWLLSSGLPIVNMTADVPPELMPSVHGVGGGILAVKHLVSLGIREIAHVGFQGALGSERRFQMVTEEAGRHGCRVLRYELTTDPVGSLDSRVREAASEPGLLEFLAAAPRPLGVAALNDDFGRCVCLACQSLGLRIPEDVAVVGVDDSSAARLCDPPLTSVRPPGKQIGYAAMQLLDQLLQHEERPEEPLVFQCTEIITRQSTMQIKDDSMIRAKRLIEAEAHRGLTVGDLVSCLLISRTSLEKQFFREYGVTPGQMISEVRLSKAKELLQNTELSITRITAMLGYSRNSVFSAFFRKGTDMTPSEYRRRSRKN